MSDADSIPGRLNLRLKTEQPTGLKKLRGIGPKTARRLHDRGITDQLDLLLYVPRKYRLAYRHVPGPKVVADRADWVQTAGRVTEVMPKRGRRPFELRVDVDGATFKLLWFNLPFRGFDRRFKSESIVLFKGTVDYDRAVPTLSHPNTKIVDQRPDLRPQMALEPVYGGIDKVGDSIIASAVEQAFERLASELVEGVPASLLADHELPTINEALATIHVLDDVGDLKELKKRLTIARQRLIYQEFFDLQQALTQRYITERRAACAPQCKEREMGRELVRNLPFSLTGDQKAAIATIAEELGSQVPMRRLLQGDVGSGKTVVAMMAAAIAVANGVQVAMMAPTEILAAQHLRRVQQYFSDLNTPVTRLSGSQTTAERQEALEALRSGKVSLVVGTHALFQEGVEFADLGLIIVDEEHKFGVDQRQSLLALGKDPHLLSMTATPIPRSLAHAVFGDRDLTVIREKPPGRKPIRTVLRRRAASRKLYAYIADRLESTGEQAYVVYPLVEASEAVADRRNVVDGAAELANGALRGLRVGVLHGQMPGEAKSAVMKRFAAGEIDVLCSTTVIEVGVDVPNATVMIVEDAELFGLSQLHQLRGRVGRSSTESMCVLLTGYGLTDDARQRLRAMAATDDGFDLAETDLRIRGPGEFLGIKQAGLPEFRFGDILRDGQWLKTARRDARRLLLGDASR